MGEYRPHARLAPQAPTSCASADDRELLRDLRGAVPRALQGEHPADDSRGRLVDHDVPTLGKDIAFVRPDALLRAHVAIRQRPTALPILVCASPTSRLPQCITRTLLGLGLALQLRPQLGHNGCTQLSQLRWFTCHVNHLTSPACGSSAGLSITLRYHA